MRDAQAVGKASILFPHSFLCFRRLQVLFIFYEFIITQPPKFVNRFFKKRRRKRNRVFSVGGFLIRF